MTISYHECHDDSSSSSGQHVIESDDGIDVSSKYQFSDTDEQNDFVGFEAQEMLLSAEEEESSDDEGRGRGQRQARSCRPTVPELGEGECVGRGAQVVALVQGRFSQLMHQGRGGVRIPSAHLATLSRPPQE